MRGKKSGFTLIELLVVIAIIAILAAILFPVFMSAKAAGIRSKCVANMKQLGSAQSLYASDWSDRYTALPNNVWAPGEISWYDRLKQYIPARLRNERGSLVGVLQCPAQEYKLGNPPLPPIPGDLDRDPSFMRSYGINNMYKVSSTGSIPTIGSVPFPSKTILIAEGWIVKANRGTMIAFNPTAQPFKPNNTSQPDYWMPTGLHSGRGSVLWFDGHVTCEKSLSISMPYSGPNPPPGWTATGIMESGGQYYDDRWFRLDAKKGKKL